MSQPGEAAAGDGAGLLGHGDPARAGALQRRLLPHRQHLRHRLCVGAAQDRQTGRCLRVDPAESHTFQVVIAS